MQDRAEIEPTRIRAVTHYRHLHAEVFRRIDVLSESIAKSRRFDLHTEFRQQISEVGGPIGRLFIRVEIAELEALRVMLIAIEREVVVLLDQRQQRPLRSRGASGQGNGQNQSCDAEKLPHNARNLNTARAAQNRLNYNSPVSERRLNLSCLGLQIRNASAFGDI